MLDSSDVGSAAVTNSTAAALATEPQFVGISNSSAASSANSAWNNLYRPAARDAVFEKLARDERNTHSFQHLPVHSGHVVRSQPRRGADPITRDNRLLLLLEQFADVDLGMDQSVWPLHHEPSAPPDELVDEAFADHNDFDAVGVHLATGL
jgi:hypothetical protein